MKVTLKDKHPELSGEWSERNAPLTPEDVSYGSNRMVWWKGRCGHEWRARVADRALQGEGCKVCEAKFQEALPLLLMTLYTKKLKLRMVTNDVETIGLELNTYIPEVNLAIEFGTEKSAEGRKSESIKNYLCAKKGIRLVRIAEWKTETKLAEQILQAFAAADIYIKTDIEADAVIVRQRYFTWLNKKHDLYKDL